MSTFPPNPKTSCQFAILHDDGRRHGTERALAGCDGVGFTLDESELCGPAWLVAKSSISSLSRNIPQVGQGGARAEDVVQRGGHRDGPAIGIHHGAWCRSLPLGGAQAATRSRSANAGHSSCPLGVVVVKTLATPSADGGAPSRHQRNVVGIAVQQELSGRSWPPPQ